MLRAIREIQPSWIVGENVRGLTNWNGGMVFDEVQSDLEAEGYEVLPFLLPACAVNAPHRRDRIWFIAHSINSRYKTRREEKTGQDGVSGECGQKMDTREFNGTDLRQVNSHSNESSAKHEIQARRNLLTGNGEPTSHSNSNGCERLNSEHEINPSERGVDAFNDTEQNVNSNTSSKRLQRSEFNGAFEQGKRQEYTQGPVGEFCKTDTNTKKQRLAFRDGEHSGNKTHSTIERQHGIPNWENFPTQPPVCSGNDEFSGRLDGITFPKWRNESIKGYGNAVVPVLVLQLFKVIDKMTSL